MIYIYIYTKVIGYSWHYLRNICDIRISLGMNLWVPHRAKRMLKWWNCVNPFGLFVFERWFGNNLRAVWSFKRRSNQHFWIVSDFQISKHFISIWSGMDPWKSDWSKAWRLLGCPTSILLFCKAHHVSNPPRIQLTIPFSRCTYRSKSAASLKRLAGSICGQ